jgi:hypothetical protein
MKCRYYLKKLPESKLQALMLKKLENLTDEERESLEYVKNVIDEDNSDKSREVYINENIRKSPKTLIEGLSRYYLDTKYNN